MDVKDLPPVVYQLLLLSGKHGLQRFVLEGLSDFFEARSIETDEDADNEGGESSQIEIHNGGNERTESGNSVNGNNKQLQRAQGTVLMHVATAMRHSRELSQEIVKYLKALYAFSESKKMLRPFNVALAMSLAKIPFYEEAVFKLIKVSSLKRAYLASQLQTTKRSFVSRRVLICPRIAYKRVFETRYRRELPIGCASCCCVPIPTPSRPLPTTQ